MARPKVIKDKEVKEAKAFLGMSFWRMLSKKAHDERTSVSALLREAAEEKYGKPD